MGAAYVESPEDEFNYAIDFLEFIDNESPADVSFSNDVQEATLVGWVRANKIRSCFRWFLGYAWADKNSPWKLHRENPQWHPKFPQLRAYEVTAKEWVPQANTDNTNNEPHYVELISGERTSKYKWAKVTVRYRNFMMRFREDLRIADPTDEYKRHCFIMTEPRVESLTVSGGQAQLVFAESSDTGPPISPSVTPFPAPIATIQSKKGITIQWYDVPWEYLSENEDIFLPTKLDAIAGKVNSDLFLGVYEPGTILAEPYRYTVSTWAVAPEDADDPLRKVTLTMPFTFFDPERGGTKPGGAPFTRGHNLMPWGGNGTGTSAGGDGKYYLATRDGTTTGRRLLDSAPFADIFTHVQS